MLRLTLLLRGHTHSTPEHKQENRSYSGGLPEPKDKSHDTSLVGVAARRMMPKIASSDASTALETIECRSIPGAAIYLDRQRDDVKVRIAPAAERKSGGGASIRPAPKIGVISGVADNRNVISKCLDFGLAH